MDATLEKEIVALRLKAVGLNHRINGLLAITDIVNEYAQLTAAQQKQIDTLYAKVKEYESKRCDPDSSGESIQGQT